MAPGQPPEPSQAVCGALLEDWIVINGAELLAVIMALQCARRPLHVCSDSGYVVGGMLRRGPSRTTRAGGTWAHLRRALWVLVEDLGGISEQGVLITKVKGRATLLDVAAGKISADERAGNLCADAAARKGAELGRLPALARWRLTPAKLPRLGLQTRLAS